jgi:hypothetical protein
LVGRTTESGRIETMALLVPDAVEVVAQDRGAGFPGASDLSGESGATLARLSCQDPRPRGISAVRDCHESATVEAPFVPKVSTARPA